MTTAKDFASKVAVTFVALAMIFGMYAPSTQAQTAEELQQMINTLLAQIAALQAQTGTATASGFVWTRDLSQGSTGADVMELQKFLNSDADTRVAATGAGSAGMETQFFGPATAAAVSKFQVKYRADILSPAGLVNPTGYFGPATRAKANALNAVVTTPTTPSDDEDEDEDTTPTTPTTPTLQGGEGSLDVETLLDGPITIDLGKSENVLEFEVEAKDSDIAINRVDFEFNRRPWLYFKEVNLLVDGEEVASFSRSSDFTEISGGNYRARFSGLNVVIREDRTADIALELVVLDSMGGTRDADTVIVTMRDNGIRYVDGAGFSETDGPLTDKTANVTFDDVFGEGDLRVTVSDSSPEKATIVLNESTRTNSVRVLAVDVEARDSDMIISDVRVEFAVGTSTVENVLNRARLYVGNTLLSTKSVGTSTVTFDRLDYKVSEDDEREFRVEVDFNRGDAYAKPATIFEVVSIEFDAENRNFEGDVYDRAVGEEHTLIVEGLVAEIKGTPTSSSVNDGKDVTISFTMNVTAYGEDFYIPENGGTAFVGVISGPGATTTVSTSTVSVVGVTKNVDNSYRIQKGVTREVRVSYVVRSNASGFVQARLETLRYGTDQAGPFNVPATLGAPDFEIKDVSIVATTGL